MKDENAALSEDEVWLRDVYQGDGPRQLTVRAVVTGMLVGGVLSLSNVYVGLKIGWSFGVSITASVLTFALWSGRGRVLPWANEPTALENNIAQTCAGAAGYMASSGLNSAIPALAMMATAGLIPDPHLGPATLAVWICAISLLGIFTAAAIKRSLINEEQLKFPSGAACAETIRSMYTTGAAATKKARALALAALAAGALKAVASLWKGMPSRLAPPFRIGRYTWNNYSLGLPPSLLLLGAGALVGLKVATTLAAGALINYAIIGPWLVAHGVVRVFEPSLGVTPEAAKLAWKAFAAQAASEHWVAAESPDRIAAVVRTRWSLWPATALLVSANLVSLAFRWRTFARALAGAARLLAKRPPAKVDPLAHVEIPPAWTAVGLGVGAALCIALQSLVFGIRWWMGLIAVAAAVVLGVVAARATGETDVSPIGPLGKITQLLFALIAPGNATANLMTANVTSGAAAHAGELLTDVRSGYLLGASPRKQLVAQLFGLLAGSLVCVPAYLIIVGQTPLGSSELPAPAAAAWRGMAEFLARGAGSLPPFAREASIVGAAVGAAIVVVDELWPKLRPYTPSAMGLGIALVIDAQDSFAIFLGAAVAFVVSRRKKQWHEDYMVSVASGLLVGEGIVGVGFAVLKALHVIA